MSFATPNWFGSSNVTTTSWSSAGNTATNFSFTAPLPRQHAKPIRSQDCRLILYGPDQPTWAVIEGHYYKRVTRRGNRNYYRWTQP